MFDWIIGPALILLAFGVEGFFLFKYPEIHRQRVTRKLTYVSPDYEELTRLLRDNLYTEMTVLECHLDDFLLAFNLVDNLSRDPDSKGAFHSTINVGAERITVKVRYKKS